MKHYSRRTSVRIDQLGAGDLVDISASALPLWVAVDRIGRCADDEERDEHCEDPDLCDGVIFFVDKAIGVQHVFDEDGVVYARLLADADEPTVEAENEAQAAAHAVAYAAKVAAYQASLAQERADVDEAVSA
jgi:hypothetical protein